MSRELEVATRAAKEAGEILKEHFHKKADVTIKKDESFQTEADRLSEKIIISAIKREFPDHSINAEESGLTKESSKYLWLIDPLDGTTNYVTRLPFFCISIALAVKGEVEVGLVYDPYHREIFTAQAGEGATLNDLSVKVSQTNDLSESMIGYSRTRHVKEKFIDVFTKVAKATRTPKILGSTALQLCYVAANRLDADICLSQHPWDIAAGALIVKEAGGRTTDLNGGGWHLGIGDIVASNGKIHEELLEILKA